MTRSMTCHEFIDFLWRYLDGEVTEEERLEFEYHLACCPPCVAYMNTYRETLALGRVAFEEPSGQVPADVPEDLVVAILAARRQLPR